MRAQPGRLFAGHSRVDAIFTCLVAAGCHYAPFRRAANDHRLTDERRIELSLHGYEERIQVDMHNYAFGAHEANVKKVLIIANYFSNLAVQKNKNDELQRFLFYYFAAGC